MAGFWPLHIWPPVLEASCQLKQECKRILPWNFAFVKLWGVRHIKWSYNTKLIAILARLKEITNSALKNQSATFRVGVALNLWQTGQTVRLNYGFSFTKWPATAMIQCGANSTIFGLRSVRALGNQPFPFPNIRPCLNLCDLYIRFFFSHFGKDPIATQPKPYMKSAVHPKSDHWTQCGGGLVWDVKKMQGKTKGATPSSLMRALKWAPTCHTCTTTSKTTSISSIM